MNGHSGSARLPLQHAEHGVDQRIDVRVGNRRVLVGDQESVIEWAVERVEHDVRVEAGAQFARLDTAQNDLPGDLASWLDPASLNRVAELLILCARPNRSRSNLPCWPR